MDPGGVPQNPLNFVNLPQSDLAYPVLFYPDPSPSGRKSLVTDLQHMSCMHTVCAFDNPVRSPIRIFVGNGCVRLCEVWLYCTSNRMRVHVRISYSVLTILDPPPPPCRDRWISRCVNSSGYTVNFANNDCGYNDNSRITTYISCPEQSPIQL